MMENILSIDKYWPQFFFLKINILLHLIKPFYLKTIIIKTGRVNIIFQLRKKVASILWRFFDRRSVCANETTLHYISSYHESRRLRREHSFIYIRPKKKRT